MAKRSALEEKFQQQKEQNNPTSSHNNTQAKEVQEGAVGANLLTNEIKSLGQDIESQDFYKEVGHENAQKIKEKFGEAKNNVTQAVKSFNAGEINAIELNKAVKTFQTKLDELGNFCEKKQSSQLKLWGKEIKAFGKMCGSALTSIGSKDKTAYKEATQKWKEARQTRQVGSKQIKAGIAAATKSVEAVKEKASKPAEKVQNAAIRKDIKDQGHNI